jgi:hypothetical protein
MKNHARHQELGGAQRGGREVERWAWRHRAAAQQRRLAAAVEGVRVRPAPGAASYRMRQINKDEIDTTRSGISVTASGSCQPQPSTLRLRTGAAAPAWATGA